MSNIQSSNQPLVSVITPVYNTEKYISECIESILGQSYQNWEYIIVNNCSTDRSSEIAERFSQKDSRIRVYDNKEHLSVIKNWNHSMRYVSSESKYCKVVHADDWLFPDCIKKMVEVAESNPKVGLIGSYRLEETKVSCDGLPCTSSVIAGKEICRSRLLGGPYIFGSPSTIMIKSDLIRNRKSFYNENNIHADSEVCYEILKDWDFGFVHQVLSFTRRHNEAYTTTSKRMNTYIVGDLIVLKKYGPVFLTGKEYELAWELYLNSYYKMLSRNLLKMREKEFWLFHKNELEKLGHTFSKLKLFKSLLVLINNRILDKMKIRINDHYNLR